MSKLNIGIAGLGNVGSALVETIEENKNYFLDKTDVELNIVGISAKTKNKKRNFLIIFVKNYSYVFSYSNNFIFRTILSK